MKSDLYKIIYRIAYFCIAASSVLFLAEIFISYKVLKDGLRTSSTVPIIVSVLILGILLVAASIFVALYFRKCYDIAKQLEDLKASEAEMVDKFKEEIDALKDTADRYNETAIKSADRDDEEVIDTADRDKEELKDLADRYNEVNEDGE
ncbi:MAG: hypothetical protein K5656_11780 [Lachnospiraceae bacterium]|nr:hypothetical protein [Lachnospiraceae bacterium]